MAEGSKTNTVRAIVVNATPLISLDCCGQLELLQSLYARIIIPEAVYRELKHGGVTGLPHGLTPTHLEWVEILSLRNSPSEALLSQLDEGEASVIALAIEQGISEVLIDENLGRRMARESGLEVRGTVAILLRAKTEGLLPAITPCLDAMLSKRIRLSSALVEFALKEAGETT